MRDPEHQCKDCGRPWYGLEVDCPYCALERRQEAERSTPQDNDYVVRLRPGQFHELWELADGDGSQGLRDAIALAETEHVCVDDTDDPETYNTNGGYG